MSNLSHQQINEMAQAVLSSHEVSPLSHSRKCELAAEHAFDEWGVSPRKSAVLLAVKLANLGWAGIVQHTKTVVAA